MSLEVVFWDVQHGNAAYIKTPNERHIVQDLGIGSYKGGDARFSPLLHLKNKYNIDRVDNLTITHPHKDHINDILNFDEVHPRTFSRPRNLDKEDIMKDIREEDKPIFEKYFEIDERYTHPVEEGNVISNPDNWGGLVITSFYPPTDKSNLNNCSIVTVLSYASSKIIIPGDNEPASWEELLKRADFKAAIKNADILLASHHGRESGWYAELFEHFKPRLTIISDGRFVDTSATDRYTNVSSGWTVHKRSGGDEERYCVTTRSDGVIVVKMGIGGNNRPYIDVRID